MLQGRAAKKTQRHCLTHLATAETGEISLYDSLECCWRCHARRELGSLGDEVVDDDALGLGEQLDSAKAIASVLDLENRQHAEPDVEHDSIHRCRGLAALASSLAA